MTLDTLARRLYHALCLMPCACSRHWIPAQRSTLRGGPLKAEIAVIERCVRCTAKDLYESSPHANPPHIGAA